MIAERCFSVILSRLKNHDHLTFAIFDESISPTFVRVDGQIGAHTCSMVARHAKFECFPWIRLDTAHALLERSYAVLYLFYRRSLKVKRSKIKNGCFIFSLNKA